jgi:hypothetical protein
VLLIQQVVLINSVKNTENKPIEVFMFLLKVQLFEKELTLLKNTKISSKSVCLYAIDEQNACTSTARLARG